MLVGTALKVFYLCNLAYVKSLPFGKFESVREAMNLWHAQNTKKKYCKVEILKKWQTLKTTGTQEGPEGQVFHFSSASKFLSKILPNFLIAFLSADWLTWPN